MQELSNAFLWLRAVLEPAGQIGAVDGTLPVDPLVVVAIALAWFPGVFHLSRGWKIGQDHLSWEAFFVATSSVWLGIFLPVTDAQLVAIVLVMMGIVLATTVEPTD